MTCIVGIAHGKHVTIGGDSAGTSSLDVIVRRDPKVFVNGKFVIGYTDSFRMGQLLRFKFVPPRIPKGGDLFRYMCSDFVEVVRKTLKKGGYAKTSNNVEAGGTFLVGCQGRIFTIFGNYQVAESYDPYNSIGCGDSYALGALAIQDAEMKPEDRCLQALQVAEKFSGGVRAPFVILRSP
jgi:ATP-dependent protease HslVU (ClpYQ) peptidase subunit